MASRMYRVLVTHLVLLLTIVAALAGLLLLGLVHKPLATAPEAGAGGVSFLHDLARDLGIAFIVAAIVAGIFELHARTRFHVETIAGVLRSVIGDIVGQDVWNEVKGQIIDRPLIRRGVKITVRLWRDDSLQGGLTIVWLRMEYEIHGLKSKPSKVVVEPYLDFYMADKIKGYPRFERVMIGNEVYDGDRLNRCVSGGVFSEKLELPDRDGPPITMMTERSELAYTPGSYNLVMGELTQKFTLFLENVPDELEAAVKVGPHMKDWVPLERNKILGFDNLLLPGQVIQFFFRKRSAGGSP